MRYVIPVLLLVCLFGTVQAFDVISFELSLSNYAGGSFQMDWLLTNPTIDNPVVGGYDKSWMVLIDCNGGVIGFHADAYFLDYGDRYTGRVSIPLSSSSLYPITGRMVSAEMYDTPDNILYYSNEEIYGVLQQYPLKAVSTIDMGASYAECPPGWHPRVPDGASGEDDGLPDFHDGRLNNDPGAPIIMYHVADTFQIYRVTSASSGVILLSLSLPDLIDLEVGETNLEVAHSDDGYVAVYKLTSGELYVGAGPNGDGKKYVYLFSLDPLRLIENFTEPG